MRKIAVLVGLFILTGTILAQEIPKAEVYLGYEFVRVAASGGVQNFTVNGGAGQFQVNLNKNFGIVAEFGGTHAGSIRAFGVNVQADQTQFTYLFGPRISFDKAGRFTPFAEYFVGGVHNSRSFSVPNSLLSFPLPPTPGLGVTINPTTTKFRSTQNAFAMEVGGGVDIKLSRGVAIRPIELDYLPTHFSPFNVPGVPFGINHTRWQNNLRYTAGVNFRF